MHPWHPRIRSVLQASLATFACLLPELSELTGNEGPPEIPALSARPPEKPAEDKTLTLKIVGRVFDAETGHPVAKCRIIPAAVIKEEDDHVTWQTQHLREFSGGEYLYEPRQPWDLTKLRIEADGFRPTVTHAVRKGESEEIDVMLIREVLAGTVLLPDGQPAANAQLAVASYTNEVTVRSDQLSYRGHAARLRRIVETDREGRFELPAEIDPSVLIIAHEAGYTEVTIVSASAQRTNSGLQAGPHDKRSVKIVLKPWGRVVGNVRMRDTPVADAKFCLYQSRHDQVFVWASQTIASDSEGRFVVEHLPPGPHGVCLRCVENGGSDTGNTIIGLPVQFEILAGKDTPLELGVGSCTLVGRLASPDGFPYAIDWTKVNLRVFPKAPHFSGRIEGGSDPVKCWSRFLQTEEGKTYVRDNVAIAANGTFRVEGLPPTEYQVMISASEQSVNGGHFQKGELLRGGAKVQLPPVISGRPPDPIDLGTIKLTATVSP